MSPRPLHHKFDLQHCTQPAIESGIAELRDEQGHDPESVRFSTIFGPLTKR